jgi:LacI family transcriptional regulator
VENDIDKQDVVLRNTVQQGVSGIILYPVNSKDVSPFLNELIRQHYPLILLDRYFSGFSVDYVTSDNFGGGLMATQHLLGLGRKRIAFVSWHDPSVTMEHRQAGYRQALQENGMDFDPDLEWEVEGYPEIDTATLTHRLEKFRPDGVFAANDQLALAIQRVARSVNISIPEDLSLVGFDNLDISSQLDVPLTTISQPAMEMGRTAATTVIRKIENRSEGVERHILPTSLVVRQSCGANQRS